MARRTIGLGTRTRWAGSLVKKIKGYIDERSIAPDAPGFIRTPQGLVLRDRPGGSNSTDSYPFQILSATDGSTPKIRVLPGTITAGEMDSGYDGTPTLGAGLVSDEEVPTLTVSSINNRLWYKTTWEGIADGSGPGAVLENAKLMSAQIVLYAASSPPSEIAPTIDPADGSADVTGEYYQQIGIVRRTDGDTGMYLFNDTVRSSRFITFCPPSEWRPIPQL
jgi:hypothetical protein